MSRPLAPRRFWWSLILAIASASVPARAEDKTEFYISQLKTSDDFRVRTQAALALGASKNPVAVDPLCGALGDGHEAVRGASAAALGKLGKEQGLPCLKEREGRESDSKVKAQISKSIKALEAIRDKGEIPAGAKWYISVGKVTNKTSRPNGELDDLIRKTVTQKLRSMDGYAVAPKGESAATAKRVIADKKLKGFEYQFVVDDPVYEGGKVSIAMRILLLDYPGTNIRAASSPKIMQTAPRKDPSNEEQLLRMLIEDAVVKFDKSLPSM